MKRLRFVHKDARSAHPATHTHASAEYLLVSPTQFGQAGYHLTHTSCKHIESSNRKTEEGTHSSQEGVSRRLHHHCEEYSDTCSETGTRTILWVDLTDRDSKLFYAVCELRCERFVYLCKSKNELQTKTRLEVSYFVDINIFFRQTML